MTVNVSDSPARARRTAALGGFAFAVLYVVHRLLQGLGPADPSTAGVTAFNVSHRAALLASEVAVGFALLAAIAFVAALTSAVRQDGQDTLATAVAVSGTAFVAMGFLSLAAETALVAAADAGDASAVFTLNQLQGHTPIVWTITALTAAVSLAALLPRWLTIAGLAAAAVFALGSIFSTVGRTVESGSSLVGVGLFVAWTLTVSTVLWRATTPAAG